jgi:hypothetical protein
MLQHLQQTGEFRWLENTNQLLDALDDRAQPAAAGPPPRHRQSTPTSD